MIEVFDRLAVIHDVRITAFGHAGDGNLHARIIKRPETGIPEWERRLPAVLTDLYRKAFELGGTISGEHGIGSKKKEFMSIVTTEAEREFMRRIKSAFDPNGIMNPGKILDL